MLFEKLIKFVFLLSGSRGMSDESEKRESWRNSDAGKCRSVAATMCTVPARTLTTVTVMFRFVMCFSVYDLEKSDTSTCLLEYVREVTALS